MYAKTTLAVAGAFLSLVAAVPMNKRDLVWVTMTDEDVVTVAMTKTIWMNPGEATAAASSASHYGHNHRTKATSTVHSTVTVRPISPPESAASSAPATEDTPTSTESAYVAPTTTSTSVYLAPSSSSAYVAPVVSSSTSEYVAPSSQDVAPTTSSTSVYVAPTTISTSVYVAPTTSSTSEYVAPAPTSTWVAPITTTSAAPQPTETQSSGGSSSPMSGKSFSGDLTYYDPGMGACGITSGADDHIVAVSEVTFDLFTPNGNPNNNPLCGQKVSITGSSGSSYEATIVDRCVGCKAADLDLSPGFFTIVEPEGNGRVHNVDWKFV